jgi:protein-disulfide isomerase
MKHALLRSAVALLALCCLRCSESTTAQSREAAAARPAASAAASGGAVAAEGKGLSITLSDVDTKLGAERLMDMRQREYDERKQALDALLEDRLVEKEAQAQGLSIEQLKKREVDEKAAKADKAEVEQLYAQNQRRLQGLPKDQALLTVERAVMQRNREVRAGEFRRELIKKHGVVVRLEPPRYEVGVPADAPTLGPKTAAVTIVEFADYQCPFCHQAQIAVEEILKRYSGKVRFVHRDYPLDSIHPRAMPAARASRCAGEQGKFWEYHRGLLASPSGFEEEDLKRRASALGLNLTTFTSCLAQAAGDKPVQASLAEGQKLGVAATPTFFVNGRRLVGAKGVPDFVDVIEDELARANR